MTGPPVAPRISSTEDPHHTDGALFEADPSKEPAVEKAIVWLEWLLTPGPVLVTTVVEIVKHHRQDWAAVEKAKAALGLEIEEDRHGRLAWQLPTRIGVPD